MIKSKKDLRFYLAADKYSLGITYSSPKVQDVVWKYQIYLRKSEYYRNINTPLVNKVLSVFYKYKKHKTGLLLGFDIADNVFGAGLRINHYGNIVVSPKAKVGMWCDIHQGVNIGTSNNIERKSNVPIIADNVWIGPGVKLYGDILIDNSIVIGANAVVNKSFPKNVTIAGVPAKILKSEGTESINVAASPSRSINFFKLYPQFSEYSGKM